MSPFYLAIHANSYLEFNGLLNLDYFSQTNVLQFEFTGAIQWMKDSAAGIKHPTQQITLQALGLFDCNRAFFRFKVLTCCQGV